MKIYFLAASVAVAGLVSFGVSQPAQALTATVAVDDAFTVPTTSTGFQAPDFIPLGSSGPTLGFIGDNFGFMPVRALAMGGDCICQTLQYTSVEANGIAGYNSPHGPLTSLSLFWGSPDTYNSLTFYTGLNGTGIASNILTGANLSGPEGIGHHLVLILTDTTFQSITIGSAGADAFEFANLATTPIPPALPLFGTGLAALGLLGRKKKKAASV